MSDNPCLATIRGLPDHPQYTEFNVRTGPGTNYDIAFKTSVGTSGCTVTEVSIDNENKNLNGKVYQWFKLNFPDGQVGWVRDDLLAIQGTCGTFGYDNAIAPDTFAFALTRSDAVAAAAPAEPPAPAAVKGTRTAEPTAPVQSVGIKDMARVQKAAIGVTAAFEGSGYAAYNNYDKGVISYGIIQFTLAAGSLVTIVNTYLATANSQIANELRAYQPRIQAQDATLREDKNLKRILIAAANEPEMQKAQDDLAISNYWDRTINNYVAPRGYKYPLTYALLFDVSVNFGVGDGFVRMAERDLGVASGSKPEVSGVSEEQIIARVVELRKISHDKQAVRENLPGLSKRGDFWVDLVNKGDWDLQGDANGLVYPFDSKQVQVRTP